MESTRSPSRPGATVFAATVLVIVGVFSMLDGIVGIVREEFYVVGQEWVFELNTTAWGWIHLVIGAIVFLAGLGVLSGNVLARAIGVVVAAISAIATFLWLPYYPVWAIVIIALDIAVIWALTAHGRDLSEV